MNQQVTQGDRERPSTAAFCVRFFRADQFDRLRIPVWWSWTTCKGPWSHIEPFAQWGKGLTEADALFDTRRNASRRLCTHVFPDTPFTRRAYRDVSDLAVDPGLLDDRTEELKDRGKPQAEETEIDWRTGRDLITGRERLVPASFVHYEYQAPAGKGVGRQTTDGLGAGFTTDEAILDGILTLVRGDAAAIVLRNRLVMPDIVIDEVSRPGLGEAIETLCGKGISMKVKDFTTDIGIPTFGVLLVEESHPRGPFVTHGFGSHPMKEEALIQALTEAAQWRAFYLKNLAELSPQLHRAFCASRFVFDPRMKEVYGCMFTPSTSALRMSQIPSQPDEPPGQLVARCVERLRAALRAPAVFVVDLSRAEEALAVVRVLIPGIQSLDEAHHATSHRLHAVPRILGYAREDTKPDMLYQGKLP